MYFAYRVVGKTEYNGFDVPQTPQSFADDTEQRLTDPDFWRVTNASPSWCGLCLKA